MFFSYPRRKENRNSAPDTRGKAAGGMKAMPHLPSSQLTLSIPMPPALSAGEEQTKISGAKKKEEKQKRRAEALERGRETQPVLLGFNPFKQISGTIFSERPSAALASVLSGPFIVVSSGPRQVANIASNLQSSPLSRKSPENRADQYAAVCTKHLARLKV